MADRTTHAKRKPAAKEHRGRVLLRLFSLLLVVGIVGWAGFTLYRPSTFPVRHVQLTGELGRLNNAQLRDVILPFVTNGFLRVDVNGIQAGVEALPWVSRATVRRLWPDVVEVEIRERKALARWSDVSLISDDGVVFAPPPAEWPDGLPVLNGPEGSGQAVASHYMELREILAPVGLKIAVLAMNERRALTMELDNGVQVLLGRSEQQARLERFVRTYPLVVEGSDAAAEKVDLRYTNGFTVVWKPQAPQA